MSRTTLRMLSLFYLVAVLAASTAVLSQNPAVQAIYVSPVGDDNNPGTRDRPIRTLQHARDLVRRLNGTMTDDITIYLSGGAYRLSQPLLLEPADSGANGHNIIYTALPGEQPVISGALQVTGWKQVDAGRNLWSAPAPPALRNTRQLYIDGVRAQRARGRVPVTLTMTPTGYTAGSPLMANWRNPADMEFVYTGGNSLWSEGSFGLGGWTEPRCPVASIQGSAITMAQPCWDNSTRRVMLPASSGFKRPANLVGPASVGKQPAYLENAFELLGALGQWYFDRPARTIYYVPRPGEDLVRADVEAPALETLVSGQGTRNNPIHNLIFSGLQFSYATWLTPSSGEGFSEIQANYTLTGPGGYATQGLCTLAPNGTCPYGAWTKTPGNISFQYNNHVQFLNDDFVHLGSAGLELGDGSQSDTVQGCVFTDISANGLELGGVDLPLGAGGEITRDNQVLNNHIYNVAAEYHGGVGIDVGYTQRTTIQHNQLDHLPYTGISLGWGGWPDKIRQPGQANNSRDNLVAQNLIFDHLLVLADGGGIYTQGLTGPTLADGEKLAGNVIYDQFSSGHAIYSDNGSANMTITGNVMFNTNHDNWGSAHANYYNGSDGKVRDPFNIENNYWQQGNPDSSAKNVTLKGNHLISSLDHVPTSLLQSAGLAPAYKSLLNKQLGKPCPPDPPMGVAASAGNAFAYVSWSPPAFEGGAPVQSYTVTSSRGNSVTISADNFHQYGYARLPGLTNGGDYTFTVTAANANGAGQPSLPSRPVTPGARTLRKPGPLTRVSALPGDGMASIHFPPPDETGGSPVIAYTFTINPGGRKVTLTGRKVITLSGRHSTFGVVDGLENGKSYTFDVAAVNAAGEGPSSSTNPVTPTASH